MRFLFLGSKEYPPGSSRGFDPISSGGFETYTYNLSRELEKQGHEAAVLTRRFGNQKKQEKMNGVDVVRVPWFKGFYLRTPSFVLFSFFKAFFLDFDVVVASGPLSSFIAVVLKLFKGKPVIARPAGIAWSQPQYFSLLQKILFALESFTYKRVDHVVFLSEGEREQFGKKMGFLPAHYSVIPTGVSIPSGGKKKRAKVVVFVGRLLPVKGVEYLIRAMKGVGARLWVVGDGPEREKLEALAEKEGVEADFFGHRKDVNFFLQRASVFALPSLSEGLPVALLEAYAAKTPVVVTDIGLPAVDGTDALVVKPKDVVGLRKAIAKLLKDNRLVKKLSANAFRKAKTFSWKNTARGYAVVGGEVLAGK
ncbi:glycosyltransferase family 4 protein [Candidatus Micrarchaeota archaeon]|nr:glycosyltransferase family 4 protein [Candidatus Micrarchaeota archaeon]